jgi:DNA-binding NarL/FixJ family response regulator
MIYSFEETLNYNDPYNDKKCLFMKIVIADDSSLLRKRIKFFLNNINNIEIVGEAVHGLEVLKLIEDKKPNLVIMDIRIPEMNGIGVLRKIRELKMKVKVCILTNYPYPQYRKRCLEAEADYFLSKTEDFEDINIVITDMLMRKWNS